jgi:hypothetical protein
MKRPNTEKGIVVVVVRKPDQSVMVVGPFETCDKAVLWTTEYTTWKLAWNPTLTNQPRIALQQFG